MESNQQFPQQEKNKNSKTLLYAIIGILGALNLGLGYMWYSSKSEKEGAQKELSTSKSENAELKTALEDAEVLLAQFRADSIELSKKNIELNQDVVAKKNEIAKLYAQLKSNKNASQGEIDALKKTISELNEKLTALTEEHENLKVVHEKTKAELQEEFKRNENLDLQNKQLAKENLQSRQRLQASAIVMNAYKTNIFNKENETEKAKKVKQFRVEFNLDENAEAEPGEKTIYVRIIGPDGTTMQNGSPESGEFDVKGGKQAKYSYSFTKMYDNAQVAVKNSWSPKNIKELKAGKYTVEIYSDGYKIGSGSRTLK